MKVNISDILRNQSSCLELEYSGKVEGLENTVNGYSLTEKVDFKGSITKVKGLLNLTGVLEFCYDVSCYRCLDNIHRKVSIKVDENVLDASKVSPQDDVFTYEGCYLDMGIILKNYIVLNLPMKQVCSEECKGLCPVCGKNLNVEECSCNKEAHANRWKIEWLMEV